MLLTILFLCGSALMGVGVVHRCLPDLLNRLEKVVWGVVFGWSLSTLAVYLIARWQLKLSIAILIGVTIFSFAVAFALLATSLRGLSKKNFAWQSHLSAVVLLLLLFTPIYWLLFSTHFFAPQVDGLYSGGSASADLSFHAALTTSFLYANNFPPRYTPSVGKPLFYPFLPDFQTAILMRTGITMRGALMITSLILALATAIIFFYFALRITTKPSTGIIAAVLFLLNGGLGFIDLIRDWRGSGKSFSEFFSTLTVNYANYSDHALHWPNIITDGFIPQRTLLFGMPLGLMVLSLFASEWKKEKNEEASWGIYLLAGVMTGLLPLFHVHTFIVLGLVSGILFLLKPHRRWALYWTVAILMAMPTLWSLLTQANVSFVRLQPGWMGHDSAFFPWYLLRNLGIPLLLAVPAWFLLERHWRMFYLAFVFVLVFALTVVVSPNLFDNGKLIYYWHAMNSVIVANLLITIWIVYRQKLVASVLMLMCVGTGLTALQSERLQYSLLFSNEEIAAASFTITQTQPKSLFLTAPVTNQPVLSLAGRQILRGPTAWLWSHGYEFRDREADIRRIYAGTSDAKDLLNYYNVDYIYLSHVERDQLHAQPAFFDANFPVVFSGRTIKIYDARGLNQMPASPRSFAKSLEYDPFALFVDFGNTSFFAYRAVKASNGTLPTLAEFSEVMQRLTRDVSLDSPDWHEQLETKRQHLVGELAEKFKALTNAEYLKELTTNAALDDQLSQSLLTGLEQGTETRTTVFRKIVGDPGFYRREYNTAFVLMHYFGYLKRNPNDPPDSDLRGLVYWRQIVDRSRDYRSISRAFMESDEYRRREVR